MGNEGVDEVASGCGCDLVGEVFAPVSGFIYLCRQPSLSRTPENIAAYWFWSSRLLRARMPEARLALGLRRF